MNPTLFQKTISSYIEMMLYACIPMKDAKTLRADMKTLNALAQDDEADADAKQFLALRTLRQGLDHIKDRLCASYAKNAETILTTCERMTRLEIAQQCSELTGQLFCIEPTPETKEAGPDAWYPVSTIIIQISEAVTKLFETALSETMPLKSLTQQLSQVQNKIDANLEEICAKTDCSIAGLSDRMNYITNLVRSLTE